VTRWAQTALFPLTYRYGGFGLPVPSAAAVRAAGYSSQIGQDLLLDRHVFAGKRNGVFVDVGAHDGVTLSNSLFFERERGWTALCVEPNPVVYEQLVTARTLCANVAIGPRQGTFKFRRIAGYGEMLSGLESSYSDRDRRRIERDIEAHGGSWELIDVPLKRLDTLLREVGLGSIDVLSIDVEGGELGVLRSINLREFSVRAVVLENNFRSWRTAFAMRQQGYQLLTRLGWDEIYLPTSTRLI
jgi:FkbM family methyltransferase